MSPIFIGLSFLPQRLETEVGTTLTLPIKMFSTKPNVAFTQCHKVQLGTSLSDNRVFGEEALSDAVAMEAASQFDVACTAVRVAAKSTGFSRVRAQYSPAYSDEIKVGAYRPLAPLQPSNGDALLAVDSGMHVVWSGGPEPWVDRPEMHFHKLHVQDDSVVRKGT